MTVISDQIAAAVSVVVDAPWNIRTGYVVPETTDVVLRDGAVLVNATYVFADLAKSSQAAQVLRKEVAAKIFRSYLNASSRALRNYGGAIRSFDGDRVMAIFIGNDKSTKAVRAALAISWAVDKVIRPKLASAWPTLNQFWALSHAVGIATGEALIVRGGVYDNNDLVSVGAAPNVAAKLSALRDTPDIYITEDVYNGMDTSVKVAASGQNMWCWHTPQTVGGRVVKTLSSKWQWMP